MVLYYFVENKGFFVEVLSVTQLTSSIKKLLETRFPQVIVQGEISNLKEQASGHLYFTLKDKESQISAVLFRGHSRTMTRLPKSGDQVIIEGEINVYAPRGNYQLIARELKFMGVGELLLKLHALKAKLEALGWFDPKLKKPIPKFPKTIGVVTSSTGAVIQDILTILTRRYPGFHLILSPVRVQGEGAAQEIAAAIAEFNENRRADVLIVGRGGGSLEDLWPFNEEIVAAAIHASQIPVISAVGHETDFSISDFVADLRAPTPSAAAEIVSAGPAQVKEFLVQAERRVHNMLMSRVRENRSRLQGVLRHPRISDPLSLLMPFAQKMDTAQEELDQMMKNQLSTKRIHLSSLNKQTLALKPTAQLVNLKQKFQIGFRKLDPSFRNLIKQKRERLDKLVAHLKAIDPRNLLTKGYCILFQEKEDSVILSAKAVKADDRLAILLHDGKIHAKVVEP